MQAVKAYYDGRVFIPDVPVIAVKNQAAIVTILDEPDQTAKQKSYLRFAGTLSESDYNEIAEIFGF